MGLGLRGLGNNRQARAFRAFRTFVAVWGLCFREFRLQGVFFV